MEDVWSELNDYKWRKKYQNLTLLLKTTLKNKLYYTFVQKMDMMLGL